MTSLVRLPANGVELAAEVYGAPDTNPVVLLLHGGGQTRHSWRTTARVIAAHGWCAIAVDARGHGESDWAPDGDYRFERFAADLRMVAERFGRPVLIGASLGGLTSLLAIGRAAPVPIASGLVLVDVAHRIDPAGRAKIHAFMRRPEGFSSLDEAADAIAAYRGGARPRDVGGLRKNLRQADDGRWYWHWDPKFSEGTKAIPTDQLVAAAARVRELELPTLLIRGRSSEVLSDEQAKELLELIPHAGYVDVAGAGHMVVGDSNDRFNDSIMVFLDAVRRRHAS